MSEQVTGGVGSVAAEVVASIVAGTSARQDSKPADKPNKPKTVAQRLASAIRLLGFKLPNKSESFENEDGTKTRRVAWALFRIGDTDLSFDASVYEVTPKGGGKPEFYCGMPSTGKGFPRPVFKTDDPATQAAYDAFRVDVVTEYGKWRRAQRATGAISEATAKNNLRVHLDD